jgi:hypothetical protein
MTVLTATDRTRGSDVAVREGAALGTLERFAPVAPLAHRYLARCEVLLVQPIGPLRAADFDAIAPSVADGSARQPRVSRVRGLVIQLRDFPGWENVAGFVGHIHFVCNAGEGVRRVALSTDACIPRLTPELAEHFIRAELRLFALTQLSEAAAWATGDASAGA